GVARETHPPSSRWASGPPSSAAPFRLPGLERGRAYRFHGDPTRGAALEAPTAPHATSPVRRPRRLSGPARFWDERRIRIALLITVTFSLVAHWFVAPWNLLPPSPGLDFKDNNDPLTIPVELMGEEPPPPPEPAPPPLAADPTPPVTKDPTA